MNLVVLLKPLDLNLDGLLCVLANEHEILGLFGEDLGERAAHADIVNPLSLSVLIFASVAMPASMMTHRSRARSGRALMSASIISAKVFASYWLPG